MRVEASRGIGYVGLVGSRKAHTAILSTHNGKGRAKTRKPAKWASPAHTAIHPLSK